MDAPEVTAETLRLFKLVGLAGLDRLNSKKHLQRASTLSWSRRLVDPITRVLLRPQWNRYTRHSISFIDGRQFAFTSAFEETSYLIDDQFDLLSILVSASQRKLNFSHLLRSYFGKKSFRFLSLTGHSSVSIHASASSLQTQEIRHPKTISCRSIQSVI